MNIRPKKHLGQHFLTDENIARKIAGSLTGICKDVLEIGPGKGILSKHLLTQDINLHVIEIDPDSVAYLKEFYPELGERLIQGDFLKQDLEETFKDHFTIIGNFPYNISSQILFRVLENRKNIPEVVGMFQKEVADRIDSPPGNKRYGILSVLIQAYYKTELVFTVSENVFYPPPKVKSAVIRLTRHTVSYEDVDEKLFFRIVKAGFNQRRKTLRNALKSLGFPHDVMQKEIFSLRAEQLSVEDFLSITRSVSIE